MSKSKGNVVSPDEIINRYGADTGRLFILFASPPEKDLEWNDRGVEGCHRFLKRVWRLVEEGRKQLSGGVKGSPAPGPAEELLRRAVHIAVKKVTTDIQERFNFNTAVSAIMELVNAIYAYRQDKEPGRQHQSLLREAITTLVMILAPFAPHLAEEAWQALGHSDSVHHQPWPEYDPEALQVEEVEVAIQINGKVRGRITLTDGYSEKQLLETAREHERVGELLRGKEIVKTIIVPGKLVNIVVR